MLAPVGSHNLTDKKDHVGKTSHEGDEGSNRVDSDGTGCRSKRR